MRLSDEFYRILLKAREDDAKDLGLESKQICAYMKKCRLMPQHGEIKSDDPAHEPMEAWLDPKNHPPEDEWGL